MNRAVVEFNAAPIGYVCKRTQSKYLFIIRGEAIIYCNVIDLRYASIETKNQMKSHGILEAKCSQVLPMYRPMTFC